MISLPSFTRMVQADWYSKFINCFRNVSTCLSVNVCKFTSWISGKLCLQTRQIQLFYKIVAQKCINYQCSHLWYWKCLKNVHSLDLYIKTIISCSITIYMYLILAKKTKHFGTNQLLPLLKYMINISYHVIFHIIPFISPRSYITPWAYRLSGFHKNCPNWPIKQAY